LQEELDFSRDSS
jgi:hypothetical protein